MKTIKIFFLLIISSLLLSVSHYANAVDINDYTCEASGSGILDISFFDDPDTEEVEYNRHYNITVPGIIYTTNDNLIPSSDPYTISSGCLDPIFNIAKTATGAVGDTINCEPNLIEGIWDYNPDPSCPAPSTIPICENISSTGGWLEEAAIEYFEVEVKTTGKIEKMANGNITVTTSNSSDQTIITGLHGLTGTPGQETFDGGTTIEISLGRGVGTDKWFANFSEITASGNTTFARYSFENQAVTLSGSTVPTEEFDSFSGSLYSLASPLVAVASSTVTGSLLLEGRTFVRSMVGKRLSFSGGTQSYTAFTGSNINKNLLITEPNWVKGCSDIPNYFYTYTGATNGTDTGSTIDVDVDGNVTVNTDGGDLYSENSVTEDLNDIAISYDNTSYDESFSDSLITIITSTGTIYDTDLNEGEIKISTGTTVRDYTGITTSTGSSHDYKEISTETWKVKFYEVTTTETFSGVITSSGTIFSSGSSYGNFDWKVTSYIGTDYNNIETNSGTIDYGTFTGTISTNPDLSTTKTVDTSTGMIVDSYIQVTTSINNGDTEKTIITKTWDVITYDVETSTFVEGTNLNNNYPIYLTPINTYSPNLGNRCTGLDNIFYAFSNPATATGATINVDPTIIPGCEYDETYIRAEIGTGFTNDGTINTLDTYLITSDQNPIFTLTGTTNTGAFINDGGYDYEGRFIVFATNGTYEIEGLNYEQKKIVGTKVYDVSKIVISLLDSSGTKVGDFAYIMEPTEGMNENEDFEFSTGNNRDIRIVNNNLYSVVDGAGDYELEFAFYSEIIDGGTKTFEEILPVGGSSNDRLKVQLTIIPSNDMKVNDGVVKYYPFAGTPVIPLANNEDLLNICYNVEDIYGNEILHDYQVTSGTGYLFSGSGSTYNASEDSSAILNDSYFNIDATDDSSADATTIIDETGNLIKFQGGKVCFDMKSYAPGEKDLRFNFNLPEHNRDYDLTPNRTITTRILSTAVNNVTFNKIFTGALNIYDEEEFKVGTNQTSKIDIFRNSNCSSCNDLLYTISDYKNTFESLSPGYKVLSTSGVLNLGGSINSSNYTNSGAGLTQPKLGFLLNYTGDISIDNNYSVDTYPYIKYKINGIDVKHRLTPLPDGGDTSALSLGASKFYGLKTLGLLQGQGKQNLSGQGDNFSKLDKSLFRKDIKMNAYKYIKNMSSGDELQGIKYIEGDYTLSGSLGTDGELNQTYDTIIVKNGNLTISGSGKVIDENLGIIVLKDDMGDRSTGNLYITPDVTYFKALIYLDGAIISIPSDGNLYSNDSATRTRELHKQLRLKGSLFSRNTIGGAIGDGTNFKLPGGEETSDFNEAVMYDLNYLRRGIDGCDLNNNSNCTDTSIGEVARSSFIVEFNQENQLNPPIGFSE